MSRKRGRASRQPPARPAAPVFVPARVVATASPCAYDETLLERARTQWQFGEWERLVALTEAQLWQHPERAKLALLAAAGRFQTGAKLDARKFLRLAEDWGCSRRLIAQTLISGAHNSLACANALLARAHAADAHFRQAATVGGVPGDPELLADIRARRQRERASSPLAASDPP